MRTGSKTDNFKDFINDAEVQMFVGDNIEKYKEKWTKSYEKLQKTESYQKDGLKKIYAYSTFNLFAFMFTPGWFGYRKMYKAFWIYTLSISAILSAEIFSDYYIPEGIFFAFHALFSMKINGWYFLHVKNFFDNLQTNDPASRELMIREAGGTSVCQSILFGILFLMITTIIVLSSLGIAEILGIEVADEWRQ